MKLDARGLSCPQPVILTKKALEEIDEGIIEVLVDNKAACENVLRMAKNMGYKVEIIENNKDFVVKITKAKI